MALRILFLGENWYGSCARACSYALRRLGHDVMDIDAQTIIPQLRRLGSRAALRLFRKQLIGEYNDSVLAAAATFRPDILLAFKSPYIRGETLRHLRQAGVALYNYYPDPSAFAYGPLIPEALPQYDCVFCTKRFFELDVGRHLGVRETVFLPHGYDPEVHRPLDLTARDAVEYGHDVSLVATYTAHKEAVLDELVGFMPGLGLQIWGSQWREQCRSAKLRRYIRGTPLQGSSYAKALRAARINLGIMAGVLPGASQADETTTRTYEIPACGGFMLHERSGEVLELFEEGREIACFGSTGELADKIAYYLAHPAEREAIARAGHARCVPAYSYDNRMAELIRWHEKRRGQGQSAN